MAVDNSIKDKENLANHNVWSCGGYLNNLNGFQVVGDTEGTISTKENEITITRTTTNNTYLILRFNLPISSEDIGKTIRLKCFCKGSGTVGIYLYDSSWSSLNSTYVDLSNNHTEISSTLNIVQNTSYAQFLFISPRAAGSTLTINNIRTYIQ